MIWPFVVVYGGLAVLWPLFAWLEGWRRRPLWQLDAVWWVLTPCLTGPLTRVGTLGALHLFDLARAPLTWSWAWQVPALLLAADVLGYASHRARHSDVLWPWHALHHSPTHLDAHAAARLHPVDDLLDNIAVGVGLAWIGFDPMLCAAIGPVLLLHTLLLHADVRWTFGPLGYVLTSPVAHRAHHVVGSAGNYAGMFSFLDRLFGTHLPADAPVGPTGCGADEPVTLRAQLWLPARLVLRSLP